MKNCLDNGYYHEIRDGACFLHRLEWLGLCPDYGMETFLLPNHKLNQTGLIATSAPDHVIFEESYPGNKYFIHG
jgi:hypothetical protein